MRHCVSVLIKCLMSVTGAFPIVRPLEGNMGSCPLSHLVNLGPS